MAENDIVEFYNKESAQYSQKRYSESSENYNQFFFNKRKEIVLYLISQLVKDKKGLKLLDIACADGVITREIDKKFPGTFDVLVGTDISRDMIKVANDYSKDDKRFSFYIKEECPNFPSDIVLGLGYITADIFEDEMNFLLHRLSQNGFYLCTFVSNTSVFSYLKLRKKLYFKNYRSYKEYREMLCNKFEIIFETPYGLFIPKLWAFPMIARIVQPIFEKIFSHIFPNLFHEKVYLLRKK